MPIPCKGRHINLSCSELQAKLDPQAEEFSSHGPRVQAFVLNASLR
jgi:hypothetical protein